MTTSENALITRDARNNKHDKRKRRHVDQTIKRLERVAYKAKRNLSLDNDEDEDTLY